MMRVSPTAYTKASAPRSENELESLKKISESAKKLLWVTRLGLMQGSNPEGASSWGLARTLRTESPSLQLYTIDLDPRPGKQKTSAEYLVASISRILHEPVTDFEFVEFNGIGHINRVIPDTELNKVTAAKNIKHLQPFNSSPSLVLEIEEVGMLDSLYFREDDRIGKQIPPGVVEIRNEAMGVNMKDLLNLLGKVDQLTFGLEGGGTITRVGDGVLNLQPGDRVVYLANGDYGTYVYTEGCLCEKIPEGFTFEEMATVPVVYCTVIESLIHTARLKKGEKILIHSAAGGVGIAAVELAKMMGAEIFATVGSKEKRQFLREYYGIPNDHIYSSKDPGFVQDILKITDGGVDATLNSTIHELLRATVESLRPSGRHIEIGKMDIIGNGKLDLSLFDKGLTFAHVDLFGIYKRDKHRLSRLLSESVALLRERKVRPIRSIRTFEISEMEDAMRYFTEGKHIGKVVITQNQPKALVKIQPKQLTFRHDATYFMVGCLGGLGRSLVSWMAKRGARNFLMLSRSGLDNRNAAALIEELTIGFGVEIEVRRGDVSRASDIRDAFQAAKYPIRGVVHAAMVLRDEVFCKATLSALKDVMAPKVSGSMNLHNAFSNVPLDFFVMTSSLSGIQGTLAQGNYSAANYVLDILVRNRRCQGLPATSVALTRIDEVGYVSERPELVQKLSRSGLYGISESEFLDTMEIAMQPATSNSSTNRTLITGLDPVKIHALEGDNFDGEGIWSTDPRFKGLMVALRGWASSASVSIEIDNCSLIDRIAKAVKQSTHEAIMVLQEVFLCELSKVLGTPVDTFDERKTLAAYGVDSMVVVEFRKWFHRELSIDVPVLELLSPAFTIQKLVERTYGRLGRNAQGLA